MAAGIKILSMMMSLIIASISEITPWVFSNSEASGNAVMLDAACFDSVLSIPSETFFENKDVEAETPEIITAVAESVEVTTTLHTEIVEETEETTEAETEVSTEAETEASSEADTLYKLFSITSEMMWPVAYKSEIVEGYPRYSSGRTHHGVDIFVEGVDGRNYDGNGNSLSYGKPFRAAQSGVVVEAANNGNWNTGYGNYCIIDHGDGTQTLYAHAKVIGVSVGDVIIQGQMLGEIGETGNATSPHLHFEIRIEGDRVDPENYICEP
ncbi:MAG: M23 family metallopeptidase [Clostridia bacterium]|nr:M23 family metallopeptidase [Clostridia bacterium]